jgi:transcriptional regulator with XRE-family HTH domain
LLPKFHAEKVPTDICQRVGDRIRKLRMQRKWTQQMLADHADIGQDHLSELERGKKEIGIRVLERIAEALDVRLTEFFEGF